MLSRDSAQAKGWKSLERFQSKGGRVEVRVGDGFVVLESVHTRKTAVGLCLTVSVGCGFYWGPKN